MELDSCGGSKGLGGLTVRIPFCPSGMNLFGGVFFFPTSGSPVVTNLQPGKGSFVLHPLCLDQEKADPRITVKSQLLAGRWGLLEGQRCPHPNLGRRKAGVSKGGYGKSVSVECSRRSFQRSQPSALQPLCLMPISEPTMLASDPPWGLV